MIGFDSCGSPLAPFNEQTRIAEEIEKQFTRLEAAVAALKRVQANLKRYRAAVLKAACEGRLVPTEAELASLAGRTYEPASVLLERILAERHSRWKGSAAKYPVPKTIESDEMPQLPEGWTWASLDQLLIYLRNGISKKPDAESGQPILRISAVRPMKVDLDDVRYLADSSHTYSDFVVEDGDLLFTRYNGNPALTGVCGVVRNPARDIVHPDKLIRAKVPRHLADPHFLELVLNSEESRGFLASRIRTTAGQAGISGTDLRSIPLPLAPFVEQQRIALEADRRLSIIDEVQVELEANLKRARSLHQSILKRAFEGKLVPQDPADEPANVLLERIHADRNAAHESPPTGPQRRRKKEATHVS